MRVPATACLAIFMVSGPWCAGTEETIASSADLVADSTLVGQWKDVSDTNKADRLIIAPMRARGHYLVTLLGDSGKEARYELTVTRIDSVLFGDLFPTEAQRHEASLSIDIHLVLRMSKSNDTVAIQFMRIGWLESYAKAHPDQISTVTLGNWVVMTDSTAKVRRFLLSTLSADSAYDQAAYFARIKCTRARPCPSKPHH